MKSSHFKRYAPPLLTLLFVIGSTLTGVKLLNQSRDDRSQAKNKHETSDRTPENTQADHNNTTKKINADKVHKLTKSLKTELSKQHFEAPHIKQLLVDRKEVIKKLMIENPEAVLSLQPETEKLRALLPPGLEKDLEVSTEIEGRMGVSHNDDFENHASIDHHYLFTDNGEKVALKFLENAPVFETETRIRAGGILLDDHMVVRPSNNAIESLSTDEHVLGASTPFKVAVIMINFQNNPVQPFDEETVRKITYTGTELNDTNAYYKETSFDKIHLQGHLREDGDIFGWYTLPFNSTSCDLSGWFNAADQIATPDGFDPSNYKTVIYAFSEATGCNMRGGADSVSSPARAHVTTVYDPHVVIHELGHTLKLRHANAYDCKNDNSATVAISTNCISEEYGDPFDVMGSSGNYQFNSFHKGEAGFFDSSNTQVITTEGEYIVQANELTTTLPQSLVIPTSSYYSMGEKLYYYIDFRKKTGLFDQSIWDEAVNGISIRLATSYDAAFRQVSQLIDTTPDTISVVDSPLSVGRTFTDEAEGLTITTLNRNSDYATVKISFEEKQCIRMKPEVKIITQNSWLYPDFTSDLFFTIENRDSFACGESSFTINSSVAGGISIDPSTLVLNIPPGKTENLVFKVTPPSSIQPGDYTITQSVSRNDDSSMVTKTANAHIETGLFPTPTTACNSNRTKKADFNNDGQVNLTDYALLVREFLRDLTVYKADANCDGQVNLTDYAILVREFLR